MSVTKTTNYRMNQPDFAVSGWHDDVNDNFAAMDALLYSFVNIANFQGIWQNSTAYTVGQILVDGTDSSLWECQTAHTSIATPTTFAADRLATPANWLAYGITATENSAQEILSLAEQAINKANMTIAISDGAAISATASAAAALVSETNAATSETNAGTSETNAGTSETNASNSAVAAAASAVTAVGASIQYIVTAGTTTAYTATPATAWTALTTGNRIAVKFNATNTSTTPTLAVSGLTAKTIKQQDGGAVLVGQLLINSIAELVYDGTDFLVMSQTATLDIGNLAITSQAQGDVLYFNGTIWTRLGTGTVGQALTAGGAGANPSWTSLPAVQTIWVPAGAMTARTTSGAASGTVETTTNKVMLSTLDFDATTIEYSQFSVQMPKSWDLGTVTAKFVWSHAATTTNFNVVWGCQGLALSDDDAQDTAFGTAQTVTDTGGTTNDLYRTAATSAITIGNTPALGDNVKFQVYRNASDGSDTMAIDARLQGVEINYTTTIYTDA